MTNFLAIPQYSLFGAYFPAWMLFSLIAITCSLLIRVVFIRVGIDEIISLRLVTYTAIAVAIASLLAIIAYD